MEVKENITKEQLSQTVDLVKGKFTKSEAAHIVSALIDEKINFHKIQRLQLWESDHNCKTEGLNNRVVELETQKEETKKWIRSKEGNGCNFRIEGTLKIIIED